jgi:hypothetical protein
MQCAQVFGGFFSCCLAQNTKLSGGTQSAGRNVTSKLPLLKLSPETKEKIKNKKGIRKNNKVKGR